MNIARISPDTQNMTQLQKSAATEAFESLQEAHGGNDGSVVAEDVTRYVVVEINKNMYGISTDATVELMDSTMTQITRVSHAPEYVHGVINHRGSIIPAIDTRSLFGFVSHEGEIQKLEERLGAWEQEHAQWLTELRACVESGEAFTKAVDPGACSFGKWYKKLCSTPSLFEEFTKNDSTLKSLVEGFDGPHKRIHAIVKPVLEHAGQNETAEALKIVDAALATDLVEMKKLFGSMAKAIRSAHANMMIITEHGSQKIGLIVDEVHSVFDCHEDSVETLPDSADNSEFLKGLVHQDDGSYILIVDIEYIYKQTTPE